MITRTYQEILNTITQWLEITLSPTQPALIPVKVQIDEA